MKNIHDLRFTDDFLTLGPTFFRTTSPQPLTSPHLVHANTAAAKLINLDPKAFNDSEFLAWMSGQISLKPAVAMVYAGHQFGTYVPRLGDGRGLLIAEVKGPQGIWELHLKGAGPTPYSRSGDGRAVLRSCIREYLASEALHGLGIPTTRALCIIGSQEPVYRENVETAATLLRLARTHIRFGTFEYFHHTGNLDAVKQLADYVIRLLAPASLPEESHSLKNQALKNQENPYWHLFCQIVEKTAKMIALWQAVGFTHGVMNTDNMSVIGDTLDYGPYGFLDDYNPSHISNCSDYQGRYAFDQQPGVGLWNLRALAVSLSSLIETPALQDALNLYQPQLIHHYAAKMRKKLGFIQEHPDDHLLLNDLLTLMAENKVDYTLFFRQLSYASDSKPPQNLVSQVDSAFSDWYQRYYNRLQWENSITSDRQRLMSANNPKYILRNYLAQNAIQSAVEDHDYGEIDRLLSLLKKPYDEQPSYEHYAKAPPAWGKTLEISCSS